MLNLEVYIGQKARPSLAMMSSASRDVDIKHISAVARMSSIFKDIRENLFKLNPSDYAAMMEISRSKVMGSLERGDAERPVTVDTFQEILSAWDKAVEREPSKSQAIKSARKLLLDCIQEFYGGDSYGLLYRWAYQYGLSKFKSACGMDLGRIQDAKNFRREFDFKHLLEICSFNF